MLSSRFGTNVLIYDAATLPLTHKAKSIDYVNYLVLRGPLFLFRSFAFRSWYFLGQRGAFSVFAAVRNNCET